ncbi:winged helix-turn-helix domain-containing protein [Sphingomonas yantingensis]|uniref:Restriction endonuclease Mrr n=1 Tax=Sphingomonas yantingensis TaxID=1241761 RepID=A0A7W9ATI9_9SPHN|nr:winged helix-turn-helix domain-containing protein [Sphingomonas yantingensis]MBB5700054.1 restriction endonuclease Mrr [Sphingomonas yantingensis]
MPIPDYQALMLPVLKIAAAGTTRVPEAADKIASALGLTEAEREELLPSGKQRVLHNRIHWAKFYMGKAGLIDSPTRGKFVASEAGLALIGSNPATLNVERLKAYPSFLEFYVKSTDLTGASEQPAAQAAKKF